MARSTSFCFFLLCIWPRACSQEEVEVAIIGAGYSGLAAAMELQKSGISFRVFEAQSRVGGRTLNWNVGKTNRSDDVIELGGEWLAPEHKHARTLFTELGFPVFKRKFNLASDVESTAEYPTPPCAGNCSIRVKTTRDGWKQATLQDDVFGLLSKEVQDAVKRTEAALFTAAIKVPCDAPLSHPSATYYDSLSFEAYLREVQKLTGDTLRDAYNWMTGFADDADSIRQVSTLAVLWERNCTRGMLGGPYEDLYRVRGGTQGPALALFSKMRDHVQLGARVSDVRLESSGKHTVATTKGTVLAKHVIVAGLPPALVLGIHFQPPLPSEVAQWLQRYPLGTSLKYSLVYKTPWWRAAGFLGKILVYNTTHTPNSSNLFTAECLDNSPYSWSRGVLMCFVEGPQNRAFMKLSESERKSAILSVVAEAFGNLQQENEVEDVVEHNWADDEYSRGAYSTFPMPGVLSNFWNVLSNIFNTRKLGPNGLWIAGADYSTAGLGYIDGAISSGMQAAGEIIKELELNNGGTNLLV